MSTQLGTYSGRDVSFALAGPLSGNISGGGIAEKGLAQLTVRMATTQSVLQVAMDGSVVPSVVPGDNGEMELQVWQTSTLQQQLINWHNQATAARDVGDVSNWFGQTCIFASTLDGSSHIGTGCALQKVPDKTYAEQAGRVTWIIVACSITNQ
jgi:hypothetical protein